MPRKSTKAKGPGKPGPRALILRNKPASLVEEIDSRRSMHDHLLMIAAMIEEGKSLGEMDRDICVAALRSFAVRYKDERTKNATGRPRQLDPGLTAVEVALILRKQRLNGENVNKAAAYEVVCARWGIDDVSTVAKAAGPMLDAALQFVGMPDV